MYRVNEYVNWLIDIANDKKHGYDQVYRWGERGDYDCSSLTITALEKNGIPVKSGGATYTGNMYGVLLRCGFVDITNGINLFNGTNLKRGDILLNHKNHVAVYIGNKKLVQASSNEYGKVTGGAPGDQKQERGQKGEINISPYYNYPWNCVLRFKGSTSDKLKIDGYFGILTCTKLQQKMNTTPDGILSDQPRINEKYWVCARGEHSIEWHYHTNKGSECVKALQRFLKGLDIDGFAGCKTIEKLQIYLRDTGFYNDKIDGYCGSNTCKALQQCLNK